MLSRTDSIGDVVLTLPMAGLLKKYYPQCKIFFLGRTYTKDVAALSEHVDGFVNYDELMAMDRAKCRVALRDLSADVFIHVFPRKDLAWLAFVAGIRHRAGTRSRWYHWLFCNHLLHLPRMRSKLHESQLNLKMLTFLNIPGWVPLEEVPRYYGFSNIPALEDKFVSLLDPARVNVVLHPRSKGSAVEWGIPNFRELIAQVNIKKFKFFVSGTREEGDSFRDFIERHPEVTDLTGLMSLGQFIAFIKRADALVAASTGPLHLAAALGITAVGLYSPRRPIFPRRWAPVGPKAHALVFDPECPNCAKGKKCDCIHLIRASRVKAIIDQ